MSTDSDRDQSTDRLLRASLRRGDAAGGEACLDAERLAAWADGTLSGGSAAEVEAHLADCPRCQAIVAAFAMSEIALTAGKAAEQHAPAPVVIPFRPRSVMRWLVPLAAGTVAATLLIWTAAHNRDAVVGPQAETMAKPEAPAMPSSSMTADKQSALAAPGAQPSPPAPARTVADERQNEQKPRQAGQQASGTRNVASPTKSLAAPTPVPAPPPASPPKPPPAASPVATTAAAGQRLPPATSTALPVAAGAATGRAEVVMLPPTSGFRLDTISQSRVVAEFASADAVTPGIGQAFRGGGRGAGGGGRAAPVSERVAPRIRWRVLASGQVEKSTDAGEVWKPVVINPPVSIVNGAAPSDSVCWLVGRAGIVMLSTDGVKFTRVAFHEITDVRSVKAIDARQATVTTADGRMFTTFDGGDTWQE